ncbi:MAG: efflux transporter outer membrane subunit [Alphaproteobacteria bacterium]|nr:efflux transporter outer membrane subunit [Alphaproteobacteria bacterium]
MVFSKTFSASSQCTLLWAFLALLPSACAVHDVDYNTAPAIQAPEHFSALPASSEEVQPPATVNNNAPWWESFERPALDTLIENAFPDNQALAQAFARVRQAQAITRKTGADRLPQVDLEGSLRDSWEDGEGQESTSAIGTAVQWELDLFDRIGSAAESERMSAQARKAEAEAVRLSLSAQIASAYFGAAAAQARLALLREQVRLDRELLGLLELRLESGIGTNVEVLQQQSRVADSESFIPPAEADLRVFENRLDVLSGRMPDGLDRVDPNETLTFKDDLPPIGIPANLLLRRPDLQAARAELIAADAGIASAIADRLPRITLDGSLTYSEMASFNGPVAAITGLFVQPLLDWGRRKAEVERNKALYEERLAAFTQLYLEAVEAVENALYRERRQREFIRRLETRRRILQDTVNETEARYAEGVDDYLPVLSALQELRSVERDLITQRLNLINIRITLHKETGGAMSASTAPDAQSKTEEIKGSRRP